MEVKTIAAQISIQHTRFLACLWAGGSSELRYPMNLLFAWFPFLLKLIFIQPIWDLYFPQHPNRRRGTVPICNWKLLLIIRSYCSFNSSWSEAAWSQLYRERLDFMASESLNTCGHLKNIHLFRNWLFGDLINNSCFTVINSLLKISFCNL